MIFASRFAKQLPEHIQQQFFQAAQQAFESSDSGLITKISALRALKKYITPQTDQGRLLTRFPQLLSRAPRLTRFCEYCRANYEESPTFGVADQ